MKIDHTAIWLKNLEKTKVFCRYFNATAGDKYYNPKKEFTSYFLSFETGARIELMHKSEVVNGTNTNNNIEQLGIIHFAISTRSKLAVDRLTEVMRKDGH